MFENAGSKIKVLAWILFIVGIISTLVCALVFGRTVDRWGDTKFNFGLFIAILAGGVLSSFISSLFLYAFGDIADNIQHIAKSTEETARAVQAATKAKVIEQPSMPSSNPKPFYSNSNATLGDRWVCKKCGTKNDKSAMYCKDCGEYK